MSLTISRTVYTVSCDEHPTTGLAGYRATGLQGYRASLAGEPGLLAGLSCSDYQGVEGPRQ